jgi:predicted dehydrogenase
VVGCGRIGSSLSADARVPGVHSHAQAYAEHPRIELIGLADPDAARLDAAVRTWRVPGDRDALALCARVRPDVVSICTPDETHAPIARELLARTAPRLLFMEKPLAATADEAATLAATARTTGTSVAVNHTRRYVPAFRTIANEIRSGDHGRVLLARGIYGKGLAHNGVHMVDLLRLWLGEPTEARGRPAAWGPDGDDTFDLDLAFGDTRARIDGFDERAATVFELELLTERTRIRFSDGGDRWEFGAVADSPRYAGYRSYVATDRGTADPLFQRPLADALRHAVDDIVRSLDGDGGLSCDAAEAIATLRIVDRVRAG